MFAKNLGFQKTHEKLTAWSQQLLGFMVTHVFLLVLHSDLFYTSILIAVFKGTYLLFVLFCFLFFFGESPFTWGCPGRS